MSTYIIAEAGVNHNGREDLARDLIAAAKEIGADAVKFQLFSADTLTTQKAQQAEYQKKHDQQDSQYEMLKKLELTPDAFRRLQAYAQACEIAFIATPFDLESLVFLVDELHVPLIKIGSGDLTNGPLLLQAAQSNKPIILSTGMSTLEEVTQALKIMAFGLMGNSELPTQAKIDSVFQSPEAQQRLREKVSLLHCVSEYPAPTDEMNLRAMDTLRQQFGLRVGLSDHTLGITVALAAVAREAAIIEKHFTLDRQLPGPDHPSSLDVDGFKAMVEGIRTIEKALGDGVKRPTTSELKNRDIVRRSLVANVPIQKGEIFTKDNVILKRPSHGMTMMQYWDYLGKIADKPFEKDEVVV